MRHLALLLLVVPLAAPVAARAATTTTTTITADTPDPSAANAPVTVSYTVTGDGSPAGNVFVTDGEDSCTGTVAAGQCSLSPSTSGARTLLATYDGNDANEGSTSEGEPHLVNTPPVITVLTGGACTSTMATTMRLSVTDADGNPTTVSIIPSPTSPIASLALGGTGTDRTLAVTAHAPGLVNFLLLASDGLSGSGQRSITVKVGGNGSETITGGAGTDVLFGVNGADTLNGMAGADYICSGNGTGTTAGGDGNDTLDGQNGVDVMQGGNDNDVINGGNGNDRFSGGLGTDTFLDFTRGDTTDGT